MNRQFSVPVLAALAAVLALAAPAAAQEDGCTQTDPCPIDAAVDAAGFTGQTEWNVTAGDWFVLIVANLDETFVDHTVAQQETGISLTAAPVQEARSEPFRFPAAGDYLLEDSPTGDVALVRVLDVDAVAFEEGAAGNGTGDGGSDGDTTGTTSTPGLPLLALVAALGAMTLRRRSA